MVFMGEVHTPFSIAGAALALGGGLYYGWSRMELDAKKKAEAKAVATSEPPKPAPTEATPLNKKTPFFR